MVKVRVGLRGSVAGLLYFSFGADGSTLLLKAGLKMRDIYLSYDLSDRGGRRIGIERRRFSYSEHIPERRCGEDRRTGTDRRSGADRRTGGERRAGVDRRSTSRGDRREKPNRRGVYERRVSDERRTLLQDRRGAPRGKEASHEKRGQELQDLLER